MLRSSPAPRSTAWVPVQRPFPAPTEPWGPTHLAAGLGWGRGRSTPWEERSQHAGPCRLPASRSAPSAALAPLGSAPPPLSFAQPPSPSLRKVGPRAFRASQSPPGRSPPPGAQLEAPGPGRPRDLAKPDLRAPWGGLRCPHPPLRANRAGGPGWGLQAGAAGGAHGGQWGAAGAAEGGNWPAEARSRRLLGSPWRPAVGTGCLAGLRAAMGGVGEPGGERGALLPTLRWEQIRAHNLPGDKWLVIERRVYDISQWAQRHPGGSRLIGHHGAEDATEAFHAFHQDLSFVRKFLRPLLIGELAPEEPGQDGPQNARLIEDFRALCQTAKDMHLFEADPGFFALMLGHILAMELLAWLLVYLLGPGWVPSTLAALVLGISQAQSWCLQHDLGHASVFPTPRWNRVAQQFVMGQLKGFSAHWWNFRHFQHHAKPNVFHKDPDVTLAPVFLLGESSVEYGRKKRRYLPYNHQHLYFFLIGPPLLTLVNFEVENLVYMLVCLQWADLLWAASFYARFFLAYIPFHGVQGALLLYVAVRVLESHWFVWVTQMNHIPKDIGQEKHRDWVSLQLAATCNVEPSPFIDWFSGHLNFQIEHHLFPTMPRHNYRRVAPLVQALCARHGLLYEVKPFLTAMADIVGSLKRSGNAWLDAYLHQ